ncbi:copper transporter complex subunit Ctr4 [Schizosaccharomyces japonicus yFS275]|uniref:Copper transport protein n=1 Tax=Schizosaccharomyces japonicus (strain yFS275 / FY16936) TaxID=402676 RepID=B6K6B8_SCHJY|nr:copper transporter complex subunit Ctr4 [Schizosaccharomyces japonicus yFS275]EEB09072.1 copper transporter complex subunit Ctr4 [Schizosaccharomyces japonicus yFS275]
MDTIRAHVGRALVQLGEQFLEHDLHHEEGHVAMDMDMSMSGMSMDMGSTTASSSSSSTMNMAMPTSSSSMSTMTSMSMNMGMSMTSSAMTAASTAMSSMSGMGSTSTSTSSKPSCVISMTWNWDTINTCFISKQWQNTSHGKFAGSIIGIFFLMIAIEVARRAQREYDRYCLRRFYGNVDGSGNAKVNGSHNSMHGQQQQQQQQPSRPSALTRMTIQFVRSLFFIVQYVAAYFAMLLAMYFNGYVILFIFLGTFIGYMVFGADTLPLVPKTCSPTCRTDSCAGGHPMGHEKTEFSDSTSSGVEK